MSNSTQVTIGNITLAIVFSGTTVKKNRMSFRYEKCAIVARVNGTPERIQDTKNQKVLFEWAAYPYASENGRGADVKADAERTLRGLVKAMERKTWKGALAAERASEAPSGSVRKLRALDPSMRKGSI